jgi:glutamate carboxypeptidase
MQKALDWLDHRARDMEELLRELVEISSHTPNIEGNDRCATRLTEAALQLGKKQLNGSEVRGPTGRYGLHVVCSTEIADEGGATLLIGHHDTVFPAGSFSGFREDGPHLRGPGVLDMKGGLVVCLYALGALAEADLLHRVPVKLISVSDEEVGSPEGKVLVEHAAPGAVAALVFESGRSGDLVITRRKGTGGLTVTAHGKAAHAGNLHHEGGNAIWALARFIDAAQRLTDYDRGVTVNVGRVAGGIGKNTVPDHAEALVDFRFVTNEDGEATLARLKALPAEIPGTSLEFAGGIGRPPLERSDASARLAAEFSACLRESGLGDPSGEPDKPETIEEKLLGGGSDANTAAACGVPAIDGLGPRGKGYHTIEELIERDTLVPKAQALVRYLASKIKTS